MSVYIVLYLLIILLCFFELNIDCLRITNSIRIKSKDISWMIVFLVILFLGIFRYEYLGVDGWNYQYNYFVPISKLSFKSVFSFDSDWGYAIINWLISRFTENYWAFRGILFTVVFTSVSLWLKKYSPLPALSYLAFLCLGFLNVDFYLLRLSTAVSIYIWSYKYLIERKPLKYYAIILLAMTCHKSALFMIIIYPIVGNQFRQLKGAMHVIFLLAFFILSKLGAGFISSLYGRNDYSWRMNSGNGYVLLAYMCIIILTTKLFEENNDTQKSNQHKGLLISLIYPQVLATAVSIATRITKYPESFLLLIIPEVAFNCRKKTGNLFLLVIISILSVLFFYNIISGAFFNYVMHFSS